jgi:hypothetical protein
VQLLRGYNQKHPKTWDENLIYCWVYYGLTQVLTTILPTNPSTIDPSRYQKETQRTKCIAHSHPRWLLWMAAGLRCLQPRDGMCFSQRHVIYSFLTFKSSLYLTPDIIHIMKYFDILFQSRLWYDFMEQHEAFMCSAKYG